MLLLTDGRLDDGGVESVRDQADDQVMLSNLSIEGLVVGDVEGDGVGILDALRERLCGLECSASCRSVSGLFEKESLGRGQAIPTVTGMPDSERISRVGLVTKPAPSIRTLGK